MRFRKLFSASNFIIPIQAAATVPLFLTQSCILQTHRIARQRPDQPRTTWTAPTQVMRVQSMWFCWRGGDRADFYASKQAGYHTSPAKLYGTGTVIYYIVNQYQRYRQQVLNSRNRPSARFLYQTILRTRQASASKVFVSKRFQAQF